jgi:uncharacterized DUF497 family protein
MRILWDEPKRLKNLAKHGLDFAALDGDFFEFAVVTVAPKGRRKAIGRYGESAIAVVFGVYGSEAVSIVSMRRASRAERRLL